MEVSKNKMLKKNRKATIIMATIFTLVLLTVSVLLDSIFGSLIIKGTLSSGQL